MNEKEEDMFISILVNALLVIYIGAIASFIIYKLVTNHYKKTWHKKRLDLSRDKKPSGQNDD